MNLELVDKIAKAVLYEGYMLYPYRASAVKNRQRWNFGTVYPEAFSSESNGTDPSVMQTQCIIIGNEKTTIHIMVRFLHLQTRQVAESNLGTLDSSQTASEPWQEAVEREASARDLVLGELCKESAKVPFSFCADNRTERLQQEEGTPGGFVIRRQQAVDALLEVSAERIEPRGFRITAQVTNRTAVESDQIITRDEALMRSLVSTHTIIGVRQGEFVSLLDPPDDLRESAAACSNIGTYPVLVGRQGDRNLILSSPIILYDYPEIAPESAGELFDSTEIDEILTLRILTLTDEEKQEIRKGDERARKILDRTETLSGDQLMKLHGAIRGLRPVTRT
jgi:hydrogenase maturation protease